MPNLTTFLRPAAFVFLLFFSVACSTSKQVLQQPETELKIAQQPSPQPYMQVAENALVQQTAEQPALQNKADKTIENRTATKPNNLKKNINSAAKQSVKKIKSLVPDTRTMVQSASKEWKPNKQNFSLGWKDIVFVLVLLGLLALLGGILYNLAGLSMIYTLLITIGIAFLVICIYLWYLHND